MTGLDLGGIMSCNNCSLGNNYFCNNIQGIGNKTNPTYFIVSDWVRHEWVKQREVFSGPVRIELMNTLKGAKIEPSECFFTSLVRCPTIKGSRLSGKAKEGKPKKENIDKCSPALDAEIRTMKPKVIIALGELTFNYFFPKLKLAEKRCQILFHEGYNCYVVGIYHVETMTLTAELDRIILKAFQQAKAVATNPQNALALPDLNYKQVYTINCLKNVLKRVKEIPVLSYDVEASSLNPREAKLLSIGLSWKVNTGVAFPIYVKDEDKCCNILLEAHNRLSATSDKEEIKKIKEDIKKIEKEIGKNPPLKSYWGDKHEEVMQIVKEIFATPCKKGGHNIDYDNKVLYYNGVKVNNATFDTMLMHHMLDEERPKDLDYLSWVDTNKGGYKMAKEKFLTTVNTSFAHIPLNVLLNYNAGDADTTLELYEKYKPMIIAEGMAHEFAKVRMPLLLELIGVSITGMKVDRQYLITAEKELKQKVIDSEAKIKKFLLKYYPKVQIIQETSEKGKDPLTRYFNIKSSADLKELIYDKMGVKATVLTESGQPSTNEAALIKLAKKHEIINDILEHRKNTKFYTSYIRDMIGYMDENDRVHANFKIATAVTGRMSVTDPALQTIPRESTIKKIFIPEKGYGIMEVDFSQQELRCLAYLSGDPAMCDAYANNKDLHMELAKSIFKKDEKDISKEERTIAKVINFLTSYGGGPSVLMENLEKAGIIITKSKAEKMLEGWDKKFSMAVSYLNKNVSFFMNHGYLQTPAGLKKHLYKNFAFSSIMEAKKRECRNYMIQSYCSSISFTVILDIIRELRKRNMKSRVISTVHDSIIIEYALDELKEVLKICKDKTWRTFPAFNGHILKSDCALSEKSWGDKKEVDWETGLPKEK